MKFAGNHGLWRFFTFATLVKICAVSFYFGYRNAVNESSAVNEIKSSTNVAASDCTTPTEISATMRREIDSRVKEELSRVQKESYTGKIFPDTVKEYAVGALRVSREEMLKTYDFGVPFKQTPGIDTEVIILYNKQTSLPSDGELKNAAIHGKNSEMAKASVSGAMESCDSLNVIFTPLWKNEPECQLLIGNFESYHINRWLRMPEFNKTNGKNRQLNHTLPLRHVGRITVNKGIDEFELPELYKNFQRGEKGLVLEHFDRLGIFLENVDSILKDLKELLERRHVVRDNTVVVLTVNAGQSELLSNFICSARSRGLDTGNILVFPTDEASNKLAQGLGIATYWDAANLGGLPSGEAKAYGDPTFA